MKELDPQWSHSQCSREGVGILLAWGTHDPRPSDPTHLPAVRARAEPQVLLLVLG